MHVSISKHTRVGFVAGFVTLAIVGSSIGAAVYQNERAQNIESALVGLNAHYSDLQNRVNVLALSLKSSGKLSEGELLELQSISERSAGVAVSQDQLLTSVVAKTVPAVVSIVISKDVEKMEVGFDESSFFGFRIPVYRQNGVEKQEIGAGSGFIIDSDGHILTNRHVAFDDEAEYSVLLATGEEKIARVIYRDPHNDLAIMKIPGSNYPFIELGNSSSLKLGQSVIAIGNALGEYSNSVSVGIISGLDRSIEALDQWGGVEKLSGVIQTDAAINSGNSGGPLIDVHGRAIAVNVAVVRGGNSIAFAIPIDKAYPLLKKMAR
jgi:S1-C subfamily serine protease